MGNAPKYRDTARLFAPVCDICGSEKQLIVHHADGDKANNDVTNLVRLCRACHVKKHMQERADKNKYIKPYAVNKKPALTKQYKRNVIR